MPKLFSYVVDHDYGYAPNPSKGTCSLVHCKFGGLGGKRNIVEMADEGDWILGTGGSGRHSAGNGRIIYAMRVDRKIPFSQYLSDPAYAGRNDCHDLGHGNLFALLSNHFFYFGRNALDVDRLPSGIDRSRLFKYGMGYRSDMPPPQMRLLIKWLEKTFRPGVHGHPCSGQLSEIDGVIRVRFRCRRPAPLIGPSTQEKFNRCARRT